MILITGGTGLVGTHTAFALTQKGQRVRLLRRTKSDTGTFEKVFRFYSPDAEKQLALVEWIEGDVLDVFSLEDAMEGVQHVYHCAAMVSFVKSDRDRMLRANIEGTANIVNAALEKKIAKLCHVSSVASLGRRDDGGIIDENVYWKNDPSNSWYAISKYGAEREAWRGTEEGLDVIIVNPSLILGPGDETRSSLALFRTAKKGLNWYTEGITGYVDVRDVAAAMVALMESDVRNERFILSAENLSYRDVIGHLNSAFGKKEPRKLLTPFIAGLAWRGEQLLASLSGRAPRLTKETAMAAQEKNQFAGEKIRKTLTDFSYRPVADSIKEFAPFYK